MSPWWTILSVACLMSHHLANVSQGRFCSDNCMCCYTETEVSDQTFYLTQSQYTDTEPTSPNTDVPGMVVTGAPISKSLVRLNPKKSPQRKWELNLRFTALKVAALTTRPTRWYLTDKLYTNIKNEQLHTDLKKQHLNTDLKKEYHYTDINQEHLHANFKMTTSILILKRNTNSLTLIRNNNILIFKMNTSILTLKSNIDALTLNRNTYIPTFKGNTYILSSKRNVSNWPYKKKLTDLTKKHILTLKIC